MDLLIHFPIVLLVVLFNTFFTGFMDRALNNFRFSECRSSGVLVQISSFVPLLSPTTILTFQTWLLSFHRFDRKRSFSTSKSSAKTDPFSPTSSSSQEPPNSSEGFLSRRQNVTTFSAVRIGRLLKCPSLSTWSTQVKRKFRTESRFRTSKTFSPSSRWR